MEHLKNIISEIVNDNNFEIKSFNDVSENKYNCEIMCTLRGENYDEKCQYFINKFSEITSTNWIMKKRVSKPKRFEFRKLYVCQLSERNKIKIKTKGVNRNFNCDASINIKFPKTTKNTLKKSPALRKGLNVVININFDHSHSVNVAQSFGLLRCSENTKQQFHSYFESGMTSAAAKLYHEMKLMQSCEQEACMTLANSQKNPTDRQVNHLYAQWRLQTHHGNGDITDILNVLKRQQENLSSKNVGLCIKEDPVTCVIITPIMRRVFLAGLADEMVFIDTNNGDQKNTFIFADSKIGPLPIAVILHSSQSEENYTHAFETAKHYLESNCGKLFQPAIIMTDDNNAEINALRLVFPTSKVLLSTFHVNQALWQWLWNTNHGIPEEDRKPLMIEFRRVMCAKTVDEAGECMSSLLVDERVEKNKKICNHFNKLWARREEWCLAYRLDFIKRRYDTNSDSDASIRVFKDIVLQCCKVFNMCAFVEFVVNLLELYHKRRLLKFADGSARHLTLAYEEFCQRSEKVEEIITQVDSKTFCVKEGDYLYTVDCELVRCDCLYGAGGRFCRHLCAVERDKGITFETSSMLTNEDRQSFAILALGNEFSPQDNSLTNSEMKEISESENYTKAVSCIKVQFQRITGVLENDSNPKNTDILKEFSSDLSKLETPASIISFISEIMNVQPTATLTSLAHHKDGGDPPDRFAKNGNRKRVGSLNLEIAEPPAKK